LATQGDPEGPARPLREQPEEGKNLVDALVVTRDRVTARLMEDSIVGKQLSQGVGVASGEGVVGSAGKFLVGMCHGRDLLSAGGSNAMRFRGGGPEIWRAAARSAASARLAAGDLVTRRAQMTPGPAQDCTRTRRDDRAASRLMLAGL
jgi:hypothetical protein